MRGLFVEHKRVVPPCQCRAPGSRRSGPRAAPADPEREANRHHQPGCGRDPCAAPPPGGPPGGPHLPRIGPPESEPGRDHHARAHDGRDQPLDRAVLRSALLPRGRRQLRRDDRAWDSRRPDAGPSFHGGGFRDVAVFPVKSGSRAFRQLAACTASSCQTSWLPYDHMVHMAVWLRFVRLCLGRLTAVMQALVIPCTPRTSSDLGFLQPRTSSVRKSVRRIGRDLTQKPGPLLPPTPGESRSLGPSR